uniref:Zona pellucida sperm-binding protein 3 n=1 Tax=Mola mola TaxID=94237 RepID=A0A3Q3VUZ7_MOLML
SHLNIHYITVWRLIHLISEIITSLSLAFPPQSNTQDAGRAALAVHQELQAPLEGRERMNTVRVTCHPNMLEITVKADLFGVGAPVHSEELHLGVENYNFCRAVAASADEYRIAVGLEDCGTKHWMTEDALIYTNLLIFSPLVSPDGLVRMDEAVIPVECHYKRKYSLSSSSLAPTWIPFMSTQAAVETLEFDLRIMTTDWLYERSSNVFYLGESVGLEASVKVGHHMGLRVFMSSCVATLYPDIYSVPKYLFLESGCLVDSQLSDSRSQFLPRIQDDKLHLVIDAFKFHNEDKGQVSDCLRHQVEVGKWDLSNELSSRWRSADGNDYLCSSCPGQSPSNQGKFGPRGFEKPAESEAQWMSGPKVPTGEASLIKHWNCRRMCLICDACVFSVGAGSQGGSCGGAARHAEEWACGRNSSCSHQNQQTCAVRQQVEKWNK